MKSLKEIVFKIPNNNKSSKEAQTQLPTSVEEKACKDCNISYFNICNDNLTKDKNLFQNTIPKELHSIIVKFHIDKETFASTFKNTKTVDSVKQSLADVLEIEQGLLTLQKDGIEIDSSLTLADIGVESCNKIRFELSSLGGDEGKALVIAKVKENIPTLDVITVHVAEGVNIRDIVVEIENQCCQKEWLGGYRNKLTGNEYHHALSQTAPIQRKVYEYTEFGEAIPLLYHRDTQTPFKPKEVGCDTVVNKATQMWKTELYIQSKTDKIITAGPYKNYENWCSENDITEAVMIIQRSVRKWIQRKKFYQIISLQKILVEDLKKQKLQILKEQADKEREIITSASYPVKRDDFYMLYLMVGKWWKREWKRICDLRSAESVKAEAVLLLQKEVKLLENIEKHRISVKSEALKKERMRFLEQTSRPVIFKNKEGQMIAIDDLDTQRAREFKEIYSALIVKNFVPKERIELLFTIKDLFVTNYMTYEYANDLVSLIQQEIDLLTIGTKQGHLKGLNMRIEQLYMNFMEQQDFNPKAGKYKKPNFPKTLHDLFLCTRCLKMLPASKYPVHVRMIAYTECKSCVWLKNIGHQRVDMSPYLKLLKQVQNSEMEKCCYSAVCFILQPIGMGYLTNIIWHAHSAISECRDMSKLQHVRWISDVEWAPWNTILLTDQEAKCHASIPNIFEFYDKIFIENVRQKHILARKQFITLLKMDHEIRSSGAWSKITDSGPFLHPSHADELAANIEYDQF